jgi:hypothetical protein
MITFWHFKRDELDGKPVEWEKLFFFFLRKKERHKEYHIYAALMTPLDHSWLCTYR